MAKQNNITTLYVVEVFFSLQSKNNHTPILVNEIQDIVTSLPRAISMATDIAKNYFTPTFVKDAVNDVVVRAARLKNGTLVTEDGDLWSAAAERILAWQNIENE